MSESLCVEALGLCWLAPPVAAVPVPPGSIWVAGTPDAMSFISKPFLSPLHRVFHRRLCCSEGWIANCQFNNFPPTPALGHEWMSWHRMQSCYSCFFLTDLSLFGRKKSMVVYQHR